MLSYINPRILKWARKQSGLSPKEAAGSYLNPAKLKLAEEGEEKLTFKQLIQIAKIYGRNPAFFYFESIPSEQVIENDFRTLKSEKVKFSPSLRKKIQQIKVKRKIAVKYKNYDQEYDYSFLNSISLTEEPEAVGEQIRSFLDISMRQREKWKNQYDAFNEYRDKIEKKGILVFQVSGIDVEEMRGFSISKTPYPVIVINRADSPLARIFSLLHELCHLMLEKGGICTFDKESEKHYEIEKFCNMIAGATLVPGNELKKIDLVQKHIGKIWEESLLKTLSRTFWASQEVILRRLLIFALTSKTFYMKMRNKWIKSEAVKKSKGFELPYQKVLNTNPNSFIKIVLNAMYDNKITMADLSNYLDVSLKHLDKIQDNLK
ncbi:MAG: ImmA/IrrE family metallo-endopeptidase [Promethearchaeota archaeon]|nr:MAG: ImmA/IrrE family metallo-endopeptidase [Candidatus Lokiarchaeota archaeon]